MIFIAITSFYLYLIIKKISCRFYAIEKQYIEGRSSSAHEESGPNHSDSELANDIGTKI
jgi:hypothetical protein